MKQSIPKSVDEYIAAQPEALRPKLEQVRAAIRKAVPEAVEGIGYRTVSYTHLDVYKRQLLCLRIPPRFQCLGRQVASGSRRLVD